MITATDPRVIALAEAWGTTPDVLVTEVHQVHATARERGYDYQPEDLVDAAVAATLE